MNHLSVGVFGDNELLSKLGKKGTINDIAIYNHTSSDGVFTYMAPASPEKVQPLLQVIGIIDLPVIVCNELTKELAEQLVALDAFGFEKGFIISKSEQLRNIIKGTTIERYVWISDEKELMQELKKIAPEPITNDVWIPVDNYFNVKSVGTVILAVMKGGTVKKYDKLMIKPLDKEVLVKGIQSQDKDIDEASHGMRIGLSIKGVEADEIKRGYVICKDATTTDDVEIHFKKSRFAKESPKEGEQLFLSVGVQAIVGRIESINDSLVKIKLEHTLAYFSGEKCMLASAKQSMPRILGSGVIV